jgi:orotate phosphoribosyltransferase-like protein
MNSTKHTFKIEERRRKVASLLAQSMTEEEIAHELNGGVEIENATFKIQKNSPQNKPEVVIF